LKQARQRTAAREAAKPAPPAERRAFFLRAAALTALIVLVYWAGWKSKWARADSAVRVIAVDAPRPVEPAAQPEPQGQSPEGAAVTGDSTSEGPATEDDGAPAESGSEEIPAPIDSAAPEARGKREERGGRSDEAAPRESRRERTDIEEPRGARGTERTRRTRGNGE
jgi:hypothetical protein